MTTDGHAVPEILVSKATAFAEDVTRRLHRVVKTRKAMSALILPGREGGRVMVGVVEGEAFGSFGTIPLFIGGRHRLDLLLKFNCCLDTAGEHLAVEASWMHVTPNGDMAPLSGGESDQAG